MNTAPMRRSYANRLKSIAVYCLPSTQWADALVAITQYVRRHKRIPRLRNPLLFNEHLLRIKLDGTLADPLRQYVTDKDYVKHYVASAVGREYALETYDILRTSDEVNNLQLTRIPCVIKPTHMSGQVLICVDRTTRIDRELLKKWLRTNYYKRSREKNYRYLVPKIIVEEFFSGDGTNPPNDYKIFCFNGCPKLIEVDADRFLQHTRNYYDIAWNRLDVVVNYPPRQHGDPKPKNLGLMLDIARQLSKPFSSIRVDMYSNNRCVKVGELTNCHESAGGLVRPTMAERWLGELFTCIKDGGCERLRKELYDRKNLEFDRSNDVPPTPSS